MVQLDPSTGFILSLQWLDGWVTEKVTVNVSGVEEKMSCRRKYTAKITVYPWINASVSQHQSKAPMCCYPNAVIASPWRLRLRWGSLSAVEVELPKASSGNSRSALQQVICLWWRCSLAGWHPLSVSRRDSEGSKQIIQASETACKTSSDSRFQVSASWHVTRGALCNWPVKYL